MLYADETKARRKVAQTYMQRFASLQRQKADQWSRGTGVGTGKSTAPGRERASQSDGDVLQLDCGDAAPSTI